MTMTDEVHARRPGRPRAEETAPQAATPTPQRRRRASTGGFALKLDAPQREGFVRRFVNADPARIRAMEQLGYTLVDERAGEAESRTDGMGTRIARHVGKDENGAPVQAVLMETPIEEYGYGVADKEDARKPFEEAIRRSADTTAEVPGSYQPGQSTIRHSG